MEHAQTGASAGARRDCGFSYPTRMLGNLEGLPTVDPGLTLSWGQIAGWKLTMPIHASGRHDASDVDFDVRLLASVVEHSPLGMSLTPVDGRRPLRLDLPAVLVNRALTHMLGYTADELLMALGRGALTHPEDRPLERHHVQRLLEREARSEQWEKRYLHHDGHVVWGRVSASLITARDGTPAWLIAQIEDITRRREAEQALAAIQEEVHERQRRTSQQLQVALTSRICIEQAKGILAATHGISMDAAFERLRSCARHQQASIHDVAAEVINQALRP